MREMMCENAVPLEAQVVTECPSRRARPASHFPGLARCISKDEIAILLLSPSHVGRVPDRQASAWRATLSGRVGNSVIANVTLFQLMRAKTIWKLSTRRYDLILYK